MNAWLRQHRYALLITLRRLIKQPFSSFSNLMVMALGLALPLLGTAILLSVQPLARAISVTPEITIYLAVDAPPIGARQLADRIRTEHAAQIQSVRVIDRNEALAALRNNPSWADALAALPGNPLPDAVVVTLSQGADLAARAGTLAQAWKQWPQVDRVQLDSSWVQRLEALLRFARIGLIFLATCVAAVVLATVFNTVRMQALSQREEIGVARLVGATESFVQRPFLYLGALSGAVAALLAIGIAALLLTPLNQALAGLARSYGEQFSLHLPPLSALVLGIVGTAILGAIAARWSVTRNTRF